MYKSYRQISSCAYPKDSITDDTKYIQKQVYNQPLKYNAGEAEKEVKYLYKTKIPSTSYRYDPISIERGDLGQISPSAIISVDAAEEARSDKLKEEYSPRLNTGSQINLRSNSEGTCSLSSNGSCGASCGADGEGKLFAILDPRFNLREVAKHLILLEDHLFHEGKRCQDCISKHFLTIEAFLDEAVTLDKNGEYRDMVNETLKQLRSIIKDFSQRRETLTDEEYCEIAQQLRALRKPLCVMTFGFC
jgi:hypothetical protein